MTFVSKAAAESGIKERLGLRKQIVSVANTRNIKKTDMKLNDYLPKIEVEVDLYATDCCHCFVLQHWFC